MPKLATLAAVIAALSSVTYAANHSSPLDQYVNAPDPHYHYDLVSSVAGKGYTAYVLDMTSQQWRSESEVNHTIWKHWVTIVRPDDVKTETGLLFITGGTVNQKAPTAGRDLIDMAMNTHSVVAELRGIPNEPLVFSDDQKVRTEDGIVVYTWVKFLKTGDSTWPLRMPMTKASARAMDTVTDFCASPKGGKVKVTKFVVAGASKRGLTTWMTAAVDPRVVAIVPMVIDLLNTKKSFEHHL